MGVGDGQGSTYIGTEGHQKAFILGNPKDNAHEDLVNMAIKTEGDKIKAAENKAKTENERKAALDKKVKEGLGDYFYPHDIEVKAQANKLLDMGAEIMANGADPWTATDPYSREFQKQFVRYNKMGDYSKQIKSLYEADRNNYDPAKFELDSYENRMSWYDNTPLGKAVDESLLPPTLVPKNPVFELQKTYGELAQKIGVNNKDPNPQHLDQAISIMMTDPASKDFLPTITTAYNKLDPTTKDQLDAQAKGEGIDPKQLLARNQLQTYFAKEPFNIDKAIEDSMPTGDVVSTSKGYENEAGTHTERSSKTDVLSPEKSLKHAEGQLVLQPQLLEAIKKNAKNPDGTPITDEKQAAKWLSELYQTRYKTIRETQSDTTRKKYGLDGVGDKERNQDNDLWRSMFMRVDNAESRPFIEKLMQKHGWTEEQAKTRLQEHAAGLIVGTTTPDGATITKAKVIMPGENDFKNPITGQMVKVTKFPVIEVKEQRKIKKGEKYFKDGKEVTAVEDGMTEPITKYISTDPNDKMNYHQKAEQDKMYLQGTKQQGKLYKHTQVGSILEDPKVIIENLSEADKGIIPTANGLGEFDDANVENPKNIEAPKKEKRKY